MDQEDGIDPEIAAAMGFGSFGAQPQNKRRKFTHNDTDTFVQGQEQVQRARPSESGSGANTTALGVRSSKPAEEEPSQHQQQQKNHENEDNGLKDTATQDVGQEKGAAKNKKKMNGPPRGLADYIAWGNTVASESSTTGEAETTPASAPEALPSMNPAESATAIMSSVLNDPEQTNHNANIYPPGLPSGEELSALRRGVKNARGDMVYFLPSFIQDPWKDLVFTT